MPPGSDALPPAPPSDGTPAAGWSFVGHVHTHHSFDCLTTPRALAARAVARKIDVLAVTDHDTWQGAVETVAEVEKLGLPLRVIVGAEVATDQGDVIGLFLKEALPRCTALELCDAVHEQGGLVLLPHPYRSHRLDDELLSRVDLIEVHNARSLPGENALAWELALDRDLPGVAGADAHRLAELDLARVEFEGPLPSDESGLKQALLTAPRRHHTQRGSIWNEWLSQAAIMLKRPSGRLAWNLVSGAFWRVARPGAFALR